MIHYCTDLPTVAGVQGYVESQHKFRCGCHICTSHVKESDPTAAEMAEWLFNLEEQAEAGQGQLSSPSSIQAHIALLEEVTGGPSQRGQEWWAATQKLGRDTLVLHSRCRKIALNIAMSLLDSTLLDEAEEGDVALLFLSNALDLVKLQLSHIGHEHPDLATTRRDIAEAVQRMLDRQPAAISGFASEQGWASPKAFVAEQFMESRRTSALFNTARWHPEAVRLRDPGAHYFG